MTMADYEKQRQVEKERIQAVHNKLREAARLLEYEPEKPNPDVNDWCVMCHKEGAPSLFFRYGSYDKRVEISGSYPRHADGSYCGQLYFTIDEREAIKAGTYTGPLARFSGEYGTINSPRITVTPEKTPEKIAADVKKRLLPAITDYYKRVQDVIDSQKDYQITSVATLETIKAAPLSEYEIKEHKFTEYTEAKDGREYGIRVHVKASRGRADVEIHNLTAEEAAAIVKIAREI